MTDKAWAQGYGELVLAFPLRGSGADESAARGAVYRKHLDELSDGAWLHAVSRAISEATWFPTVSSLRDFAREWHGGATLETDERKRLDGTTPKQLKGDA
jgi:hypothetical protein